MESSSFRVFPRNSPGLGFLMMQKNNKCTVSVVILVIPYESSTLTSIPRVRNSDKKSELSRKKIRNSTQRLHDGVSFTIADNTGFNLLEIIYTRENPFPP